MKSSPSFPNVAQNVAATVFNSTLIFFKKVEIFGQLLQENLRLRTFKK